MMSMFLNNESDDTAPPREPAQRADDVMPLSCIIITVNKHAMKLTDFSDDILHQIYAFIPTIHNLKSCAFVNKRASRWIFGKTTDALFGAAYELAFGDKRSNGRKAWHELYRIRQCLSEASVINPPCELNTVGVLTPERETEAVGYDHPNHFRDGQCLGYFGMARLFPEGEGPLAIWGDFDGIVMAPSIEELLSSDEPSGETRQTKQFSRILGHSQVLCVLVSPLSYDSETKSTVFFLGYASGHVQAVKVVKEGDERYSYEAVSTEQVHTDEVTALAVLPLDTPCIASSSVDGTVMVYPNSLSEHSVLDNPVEACRAPNNDKILSFAATRAEDNRNVFLCTGSSEGILTRWCPVGPSCSFKWRMTSSVPIGTGANAPTHIEFLRKSSDTIVVGTTSGCLLTYRMSLSMEAPLLCGFNQLNTVPSAHIGAVESIMVVGNVLLTSGAHEAHLMAWDVRTLSPLGSIVAHPGRLYHPSQSSVSTLVLKCAVKATIVWRERESLVIFCRDGNILECSYSQASLKMLEEASAKAVQSVPPTIVSLKSFMAEAGNTLCGRMRMRVIQAGLQNRKNPHVSFVGVNGVEYEDSQASFDHFSGLSPCVFCAQSGEGAFVCRVQNQHCGSLHESPSDEIFKKLQNTKNSWIFEGEETWICEPCKIDNKIDKKRCFLCRRWKDGKREGYHRPVPRLSSTSQAKSVGKAATVRFESGPTWRCVPCKIENEVAKKRCRSCLRWKGGKCKNFIKRGSLTKRMKSKGGSPTESSKTTVMIPSKCTKITAGSSPGTAKMWECRKCHQLNHWNRYSCELCGRRSGGPVWDVTWG